MDQLWHYLTLGFLWNGVLLTLEIAVGGMVRGIVLGVVLATMQESAILPLRWISKAYIWFVRGTPLLLQLIFLYNGLPRWGLGLDAVQTAIVGFALNEASYEAEIFRGGLLAVDRGQVLAASSLGMGPLLTLRRIQLPQALRTIAPMLGNQTIGMIKSTSLASVIAVNELTLRSQQIVSANFEFVSVFVASGIMYLAITSVVSLLQAGGERRLSLDRIRRSRTSGPVEMRVRSLLGRPARSDARDRATTSVPAVACRGVVKRYGDQSILSGVDLDVTPGEVVVIMGPSGTGKSTLVRLMAHLEAVDAGEIRIAGELVGYEPDGAGGLRPVHRGLAKARARSGVAMVFQSFNLFAHKTVLENVMEALVTVQRRDPAEARAISLELLGRVGLSDKVDHLPHRLSGGQQQRVAIARALATRPSVMLFDEPTSALDAELVGEVVDVIRTLADDGMTMVIVTHEIRFARVIADRVVFMADGAIVEQGAPDAVLRRPSHERTRRFLARLLEEEHGTASSAVLTADA